MDIVALIIQVIAGAMGGNAVAKANKRFDMGGTRNGVIGAIGGVVLGQLVEQFTRGVVPADQVAEGMQGLNLADILSSLMGGGAGGAAIAAIVGGLKNR